MYLENVLAITIYTITLHIFYETIVWLTINSVSLIHPEIYSFK